MHASSFPCPHCSAPLRVRDRMFVGREIACPECAELLRIVAHGPKGLAAEKLSFGADTEPLPRTKLDWRDPASIAWALTAVLGLGLIAYVLWPAGTDDSSASNAAASTAGSVEVTQTQVDDLSRIDPPQPPDPSQIPRAAREPATAPIPSPEELSAIADVPPAPAQPDEPLLPHIAEEPADAEMAAIPPADDQPDVDVIAALAQPIASYRTPSGATARALLDELSELIGVPVELDENLEDRDTLLGRTIKLDLSETTPGDVVDQIAAQLGLAARVEDSRIRLMRPAAGDLERGT